MYVISNTSFLLQRKSNFSLHLSKKATLTLQSVHPLAQQLVMINVKNVQFVPIESKTSVGESCKLDQNTIPLDLEIATNLFKNEAFLSCIKKMIKKSRSRAITILCTGATINRGYGEEQQDIYPYFVAEHEPNNVSLGIIASEHKCLQKKRIT